MFWKNWFRKEEPRGENMMLIVGLGNPGPNYEDTRHNVGFKVVDAMARTLSVSFDRTRFKGRVAEGRLDGTKVLLLKPQTFMNLSGESIRAAVDFHKIPLDRVIVVFDDVSLPMGRIRIRKKGSAGGHNGIKSTVQHLGTEAFPRLRVGIGAPNHDMVHHVLGKFSPEEAKLLPVVVEASRDALLSILRNGIDAAMTEFNGFQAEEEKQS